MRLESIGLFIIQQSFLELLSKMADMQYLTPGSEFVFKSK